MDVAEKVSDLDRRQQRFDTFTSGVCFRVDLFGCEAWDHEAIVVELSKPFTPSPPSSTADAATDSDRTVSARCNRLGLSAACRGLIADVRRIVAVSGRLATCQPSVDDPPHRSPAMRDYKPDGKPSRSALLRAHQGSIRSSGMAQILLSTLCS